MCVLTGMEDPMKKFEEDNMTEYLDEGESNFTPKNI